MFLLSQTILAANPGVALNKYRIGDTVRGGKVFWLDENMIKGLIYTEATTGSPMTKWQNSGTYFETNARCNGRPGTGKRNTDILVALGIVKSEQLKATEAAGYPGNCDEGAEGCYANWWLPSTWELRKLYGSGLIGKNWCAWSSNEDSNSLNKAYFVETNNGFNSRTTFKDTDLTTIGDCSVVKTIYVSEI
jgi:hypothetical protein